MRPKVLRDLITSASSAKAHFEIWWAQVSHAKPTYVAVMNAYSDFFRASADAHYTAFLVYLSHLYDPRRDSSSIPTYFRISSPSMNVAQLQALEKEYSALEKRAQPLVTIRHKLVAHIDAKLSPTDIVEPLGITWNEVRDIVYDSAKLVARLAGTSDLGSIGIPRDDRLIESTLRMIRELGREEPARSALKPAVGPQ